MGEHREREKRKWLKPLEILGRYKYVLVVVALGALLLAWPQGTDKENTSAVSEETVDAVGELAELETAMEEILGKISGVGKVDVMLTLQSGSEKVLAADTSLQYSGSVQAPDDYSRTSETVVVSGGGEGGVVVTQERYPQYRGALVVCEGGGSDSVRLQVTEAVAALTGLGTDRIAVVRWHSGEAN